MWKTVRVWFLWRWREIVGVLIAAVFITCFLATVVIPHRNANWGFGPEWTLFKLYSKLRCRRVLHAEPAGG